ncbi:MAG: NAD(+) diphosphatase [Candidatus Promineofilum sp.]|nr:NAD(+) diphosphatase [Promineifilum sp.]
MSESSASAQFYPAALPPTGPAEPALWFLFRGARLLVVEEAERAIVPLVMTPAELGLTPLRWQYLGRLVADDEVTHCFSGELAEETEPPPGMRFENLRALFPRLSEMHFRLAGRAVQIVDWDRTHQYCGRCGSPTENQIHDRAKRCPVCGLTNYPRLAPAVIMRVERQDEEGRRILLGRATRFPTAMFSVLAGFVEPGETLEECVAREVLEETGIQVKNIRYFGSQPWPFPHSLMIAFVAEHEAGEIVVDPGEMAEAGWFAAGALPNVPPPPSIANRLITSWLEVVGGDKRQAT